LITDKYFNRAKAKPRKERKSTARSIKDGILLRETTISATDDIGHDHIGHTEHHIGHKACRLVNQGGQCAAASKESGFVLSSQEAV